MYWANGILIGVRKCRTYNFTIQQVYSWRREAAGQNSGAWVEPGRTSRNRRRSRGDTSCQEGALYFLTQHKTERKNLKEGQWHDATHSCTAGGGMHLKAVWEEADKQRKLNRETPHESSWGIPSSGGISGSITEKTGREHKTKLFLWQPLISK